MPKRANKKVNRIISTEMQGDDSWVDILVLTVEEARELETQYNALGKRVNLAKHEAEITQDSENGAYPKALQELESAQSALGDFTFAVLEKCVLDWNWVDDDENPLPKPTTEGAFQKLFMSEYTWLVKKSIGTDEKKETNGKRR